MTHLRGRVEEFLAQVKRIAADPSRFLIVPRPVNNATVRKLGLTRSAIRGEVLSLEIQDYCQGPQPDRNRLGEVWVFGRKIGAVEVYIKLKIICDPETREEYVKCLSFHKARFQMTYPLPAATNTQGPTEE